MDPGDHPMSTLDGACHCGKVRLQFRTAKPIPDLTPRACDCSFCRKHGAAWISDPAGALRIRSAKQSLRTYTQGSNTARFLLCEACGVLVAVVTGEGDALLGAVNAGCLEGEPALGQLVIVSPQRLDRDAKVARWGEVWIRDVRIEEDA